MPALKFGGTNINTCGGSCSPRDSTGTSSYTISWLERHRVLANYSEKPLCASKDFYIVRTNNPLIHLVQLKPNENIPEVFSRRISEKWTRFLEEDYLTIPIQKQWRKQTSRT